MTKFLSGQEVMARYSISEMTLYRWVNDPDMHFPQPMIVNRRRRFAEEELSEWERRNAKGKGYVPVNPRPKKADPIRDAAPDMLDALRMALPTLIWASQRRGDVWHIKEAVQDAIAKAEGRV